MGYGSTEPLRFPPTTETAGDNPLPNSPRAASNLNVAALSLSASMCVLMQYCTCTVQYVCTAPMYVINAYVFYVTFWVPHCRPRLVSLCKPINSAIF